MNYKYLIYNIIFIVFIIGENGPKCIAQSIIKLMRIHLKTPLEINFYYYEYVIRYIIFGIAIKFVPFLVLVTI